MTEDRPYKSGDIYGSLMLTGKSFNKRYGNKNNARFVECICKCGKIVFTFWESVKYGKSKTCGCSHVGRITHGLTKGRKQHSIYISWHRMISRCYNEKDKSFKNYGLRGIFVCDVWKNSFEEFYKWAFDNGWEKGLSLERIKNDGNYEPSNCKWATNFEQSRNTRQNNVITMFGETKVLRDWINDYRTKASMTEFYRRIKQQMSPQDALMLPTKFCK